MLKVFLSVGVEVRVVKAHGHVVLGLVVWGWRMDVHGLCINCPYATGNRVGPPERKVHVREVLVNSFGGNCVGMLGVGSGARRERFGR